MRKAPGTGHSLTLGGARPNINPNCVLGPWYCDSGLLYCAGDMALEVQSQKGRIRKLKKIIFRFSQSRTKRIVVYQETVCVASCKQAMQSLFHIFLLTMTVYTFLLIGIFM